jgi:putative lipoprotein
MKSSLFALATCGLALSACSGGDEAPAEDETAMAEATETEAAADTVAASAEEDIQHYLLQTYPDAAPMRYALAWHDLDGDGADEAVVHLVSPFYCGTGGCNTLVLTPAGPMWSEVANISVSRTPVGVAESSSNGWQDLTVAIGGGGGEAGTALLKFDGEAYPANPTVAPAEMTDSSGTELIAEEPEFVSLEAGPPSGD